MKAVCIISSDGVVIDGDVVFCKLQNVYSFLIEDKRSITIKNTSFYNKYVKKMPLKIKALWFWHMVVLRKSHVYLTGVMR